MLTGLLPLVVLLVIFLFMALKVLREYERAVVFRLGRCIGEKGPGLIILVPVIDRMVKVSLRLVTMDVPSQDVITRDNVSVSVNAVVYFRVVDPVKAVVQVEDFLYATSQLAQTTLRSVCGQVELDDLLSARDKINHQLQEILDLHTDPWGVKAKQAEAERERRSKVINAQGEFQAAQRLADAAAILAEYPQALQLRYMQTLREVAAEHNSTILFPMPLDLVRPFLEGVAKKRSSE